MNSDAVWSILLLLAAILVIGLEVFIPSGGVLALCALAMILASIFLAFKASVFWGVSLLVAASIAVPAAFFGLIQVLPYTPIGRRLMGVPADAGISAKTQEHESLVGRIGEAKTDLMPAGIVMIDGKKYDSLAPGMVVSRGQRIEVTRVSGNIIYVAPTTRQEISLEPLENRRLDELGLEELDNPLS